MRPRLRSDAGQTTAEYLGALLLVSVIIAAVALTDLGGRVAHESRVLVCKIAGGTDCGAQIAGDPDVPPLEKCITRSADKSFEASAKIRLLKLEGGISGVYRESAAGPTFVAFKGFAGVGIELSTPGIEVTGKGSSPRGEFSLTGRGEVSRTWRFETPQQAQQFIEDVVKKVKAQQDLTPGWLQEDDDYVIPPHDSTTIYGGVAANASISAGGGGAYAGAGGGIEAGLGARYFTNGDKTYFFRARAGAAGHAGFAGGFGAGGDGEIIVGITYDRNGNEKAMTVTGVGTVSAGLDLRGSVDLSGLLRSVGGTGADQQGRRIEFESTLDLRDPANHTAARAFLDGRDPVTGEPAPLVDSTRALLARFDAAAHTNARLYDVRRNEAGIDVDGLVFGFSAKFSQSDANLTDAWYDGGPGGFQQWYECVPNT